MLFSKGRAREGRKRSALKERRKRRTIKDGGVREEEERDDCTHGKEEKSQSSGRGN